MKEQIKDVQARLYALIGKLATLKFDLQMRIEGAKQQGASPGDLFMLEIGHSIMERKMNSFCDAVIDICRLLNERPSEAMSEVKKETKELEKVLDELKAEADNLPEDECICGNCDTESKSDPNAINEDDLLEISSRIKEGRENYPKEGLEILERNDASILRDDQINEFLLSDKPTAKGARSRMLEVERGAGTVAIEKGGEYAMVEFKPVKSAEKEKASQLLQALNDFLSKRNQS